MYYNKKFAAHGEHRISVTNNILLCKIIGAWNVEQATKFVEEIKAIVASHFLPSGQPWIRIMDMSDWELSTPEAKDHVAKYIATEQKLNCIYRFYCNCSIIQKQLITTKYKGAKNMFLSKSVEQSFKHCKQLLKSNRHVLA